MIVNHPMNRLEEVIQTLRDSEFKFYLTGSQFFHTATTESDWDFFIEDDFGNDIPTLRAFLTKTGFQLEFVEYDRDKETVSVWKHVTEPIHIQTVKNANLKLDAQFLIQSMGLHWEIAKKKSRGKIVWDLAYKTVRELHLRWRIQPI